MEDDEDVKSVKQKGLNYRVAKSWEAPGYCGSLGSIEGTVSDSPSSEKAPLPGPGSFLSLRTLSLALC